jgi:hypothetical protein
LALFWPRGARARALRGGGRLGRRPAAGAHPRSRRTLETGQRVAQALKLIAEPLVLAELVFDLLDPSLYLLGNRAHIRNLWHLTPALELRHIVGDRPLRPLE